MARKLPVALQIQKLADRCYKFNPSEDCTLVDFDHVVDKTLTFSENLGNLRGEYPGFEWDKRADPRVREFEEMVIDGLRDEAEPYNYDIVKSYKVRGLERKARKLDRTESALEKCQEAGSQPRRSTPGTCSIKSVKVKSHKRCKPRNR